MIVRHHFSRVTGRELTDVLRQLQAGLGEGALAVVRIRIGDERFAWQTLGQPSCSIPGLPAGQLRDLRFATGGTDGLHGQVMGTHGAIDFHLDRPSACIDLVSHGLNDTKLAQGALVGALFCGLAGALSGNPRIAAAAAATGAAAGGVMGALIEKRPRQLYDFEDVFSDRLTAVGLFAA